MTACSPSPADAEIAIIRPLLPVRTDDIRQCARDLGIAWREDRSNTDTTFLRNRVRHELVPLLDSLTPGWRGAVERFRRLVTDEHASIAAQATHWLSSSPHPEFASQSPALQREILRQQLLRLGLGTPHDLVERLRLDPDRPVTVRTDLSLIRSFNGLVSAADIRSAEPEFDQQEAVISLGTAGEAEFSGLRVHWLFLEGAEEPPSVPGTELLDADVLGAVVRLRHWRPGDRFEPMGLGSPAKLQDLFTNARVPRHERHRRVLAETAGGEIFWVEGLRLGQLARVRSTTRRTLVWLAQRH